MVELTDEVMIEVLNAEWHRIQDVLEVMYQSCTVCKTAERYGIDNCYNNGGDCPAQLRCERWVELKSKFINLQGSVETEMLRVMDCSSYNYVIAKLERQRRLRR